MVLKNVICHTKDGYSRINIHLGKGTILNIEILECSCKKFSLHDYLVTPGFVNGHLHPNKLTNRRLLDNLNVHTLLHKMHNDSNKPYTTSYEHALFVLMDAIKSGATTIYSVASNPAHVIQAYKDLGVKGAISCFFNDQWETEDHAPKIVTIKTVEKSFEEFVSQKTDKFDIHIGSASIRAASNDLLILLNELAKKHKKKVNIHVGESHQDVPLCIRNRGTTPIRLLAKLGVLNDSWNLIHTVAIDEEEIKLIAKQGASIIHCPVSNAKTGAGVAPIHQLINAGVTIALGTDACSNNNTNNILNEAYFAALLHSAQYQDPTIITIDTLWKWITSNGYKVLGKKQTGTIQEGEPADLLVWELGRSAFSPLFHGNFDSSLFYNAPDIKPHTVFIDGEKIIENYCLTKIKEDEIKTLIVDQYYKFKKGKNL